MAAGQVDLQALDRQIESQATTYVSRKETLSLKSVRRELESALGLEAKVLDAHKKLISDRVLLVSCRQRRAAFTK